MRREIPLSQGETGDDSPVVKSRGHLFPPWKITAFFSPFILATLTPETQAATRLPLQAERRTGLVSLLSLPGCCCVWRPACCSPFLPLSSSFSSIFLPFSLPRLIIIKGRRHCWLLLTSTHCLILFLILSHKPWRVTVRLLWCILLTWCQIVERLLSLLRMTP